MTSPITPPSRILITGATGTVGSLLIPALAERDCTIRALVRPSSVGRLRQAHTTLIDHGLLDVHVGDLGDPVAVSHAADGVDAVFLACANGPDQPAHEGRVIDAAAGAGVGRIVKLSARGAALGSTVAFWDAHARIEERLLASGVPAVLLRPGFLMTNLFASVDSIRRHGVLAAPAGGAQVAMIDPYDVARCAAVALTAPASMRGTYELTGPAALDFIEVTDTLSSIVGRAVTFVDVPPDAAVEAMVGSGVPEFAARQIGNVFAALRGGAQRQVSDDVLRLTGEPPQSLAAFLQQHVTMFTDRTEPVSA